MRIVVGIRLAHVRIQKSIPLRPKPTEPWILFLLKNEILK